MNSNLFIFNLFILIFIIKSASAQDESESTKSLRKELFVNRNYDKYSFPVKDHKKAVNISFCAKLIKVLNLDIKKQVITTNVYFKMVWFDQLLTWNPSDFGGQTQLPLTSDLIWKPDISSVNGADARSLDQQMSEQTKLWIRFDGYVEWIVQAQIKSYCMMDLTDFPDDRHKCRITMESFYQIQYVNIYKCANISDFLLKDLKYESPEWELTNATSKKLIYHYPDGTFATINFYITLQRKQYLFQYFIKTPMFVAIALSVIMMSFPPNSLKRFKLCFISLSLLTLVLLFISNQIGFVGNKGIPLIVYKTAVSMVFISVLTLSSIFLNLMFKNTGYLPYFVTVVVRNPFIKFIGVGDYLIGVSVKEGTDSGITIPDPKKILTETQNQWILLTLLLDKIALIAYFLFLLSIFI